MADTAHLDDAASRVIGPAGGQTTRNRLGGLAMAGAGIGIAALALVAAIALVPTPVGHLVAAPDPSPDYATAVARFEALAVAEATGVYAPCRSRLLNGGERTPTAVVLMHGLTNCPRQFLEFAEAIHATGVNVLVLRMPYHGLVGEDGVTIGTVDKVAPITAADFRDYGDTAVDIAAGLGHEVRVLGLSGGGVVAAWAAQNRSEVARAVLVAPAISLPSGLPPFLTFLLRNFFGRVPNVSLTSGGGQRLNHAYFGEATHGIAHMYLLAEAVREQARRGPPVAGSIAVVTNASDTQVDNGDIRRLTERWRRSGATVDEYQFPRDLALPHDLIDVQQPAGRMDVVYPVLMNLLAGRGPDSSQ